MKFRLIFAAGLLALGGCATYDYTGAGSGGYYRGAPAVQYRYPPGYSPYYYGNPYGMPYGYGAGSIGLYDYPVYPVYRGGGYYYREYDRRPQYRPPRPNGSFNNGQRPGGSRPQQPNRPPATGAQPRIGAPPRVIREIQRQTAPRNTREQIP
ncbi:hypothetical protein [Xanthomonas vasicola]|uniref:Uncharacterized protein n=1 Tax=Xanthomonas vasicola pv. vasculorum NCPPB 890 TaxID=1184265 RepID=A0A836ZPY0_XANVA|nr:hypothetical protein [Xanthomonas vasicola]KFA38764.1 hypothetical protein KWS_0107540 [Xanthomonas vasicola pv. musacearum NCPPB 4384]AZR25459.1 hypothetical protein NX80_001830 [Xanthomonas vasicola pv. arecae]AZR29477.1 hypothetical protein KWO_001735 [Xanthomonas vasicola pv. musacearum NCPPB 4379]KEZ98259.1 hypothetical protein A11M_0106870 [Xanthomonas vasicola pv. vasculorum NCPPB 895]KFA04820.1 hypothetical protein KWM_0119890 [Xanthomonas vasicola pv. musacearum NCPPB 2005]